MKRISCPRFLMISLVFILKNLHVYSQTVSSYYFRSAQSGNWDAPGSWETSTDGVTNWVVAALPPTSEANAITIKSGYTITVTNNVMADQLVVESGAVLNIATTSSATFTVNDGTGNDIVIQNGGTFRHNTSVLPSFAGTSIMEVQSGGLLEVANDLGVNASSYASTSSNISSHIFWNDNAIFNWNTSSAPADSITYFSSNLAIPVFRISKTLTMGGGSTTVINGLLEANANVSFEGGGTKTFRNGITGIGKVGVTAVNGGQFIISGTNAVLGGTGVLEINNSGLMISAGTTITLNSNKTINNYSGGSGTVYNQGILIAGDYVVSGTGKIQIDGTVKTTNINGLTGKATTTFATASGFVVNNPGTSSTIEYNNSGNQTVTIPLTYSNLTISGSGTKTAASGSDIIVSGVLNINAGSAFALNGTNNLKLNGSGTLNINANAVFDNGGESQVGGGGSPTVNIYGTFITKDAQGFTGTGTSLPGATSTAPTISVNIYNGSTIEYGLLGNQAVNSRTDYKNMTFSGSGIKTLPTCSPTGLVLIKDNVVVEASTKTFGNANTNLTMTGGRFRVGSNGTKPDIAGTYSLQGGVIEFTNSNSSKQSMRATITYFNVEISGTNVNNSLGNTVMANGGSFTVKAGGIFDNNAFKIDGTTGTQTLILEAGSTFKTGTTGGFSGDENAALKSFEVLNVNPKSTIVYSRSGDQIITPFSAYPTLLLKGSGNKTVAAGNITIAATADSVVIDPTVVFKVNTGARADFSGRPVFIRSTATGTGMIGVIADGQPALLNATNVTVERYIPAKRAFRFLSSSVTTTGSIKANWMEGVNNTNPYGSGNLNPMPGYGTHITGNGGSSNGFDPTITNNPSLFTYNNGNQKWEAVPNTNSSFKAGNAYRLLVRGSRSTDLTTNTPAPTPTVIRSTGALFTGSVTFDKTTNSPAALSVLDTGFSFIGNPYASSVDWEAMVNVDPTTKQVTGTAKDIMPTYWTWDPNINVRGNYVSYNSVTRSNNISLSKVDKNIQSGQAFFIRTTGANANPSLQFKETHKTSATTNVFRTYSEIPKISIQLLLENDSVSEHIADGVVAFFSKDFSRNIENEDVVKICNLDENLSIVDVGNDLSMEGLPPICSNDSLPLKMWQLRQNNYFFRIDAVNMPSNISAFLRDAYLNTETPVDLSAVTLHPFSLTSNAASSNPNRFMLLFKLTTILASDPFIVNAYIKSEGIEVNWSEPYQNNCIGYEVQKSTDGRQFVTTAVVPAQNTNNGINKYSWFDVNVKPGDNFYRIKTLGSLGFEKLSSVAKVNFKSINSSINIFPNPVSNNIINVKIKNIDTGSYKLNLFNSLSQKVYNTEIIYSGGSANYSVKPGKCLPKGVYTLQVSKEKVTINKTIIIK